MNKILRKLIGTGVLAVALGSGGASAAPFINGGISFSDGFDSTGTVTSIVSALTFVDVNNGAFTTATSCSGDFPGGAICIPFLGAFASDFTIGGPAVPMIYSWGAFTFTIPAVGFGVPVRTALTCSAGSCIDFLSFAATGVVSAAGFAPTAFTLNWTAQGGCHESAAAAGTCSDSYTSSWSSSITALGTNVPEPGSLALIGIALAGLALARRRKQS